MSTQMSHFLTDILFRMGAGAFAGFLVAFASKKFARIMAVIAGLILSLFAYLNYQGIIAVDRDTLISFIKKVTESVVGQYPTFLQFLSANSLLGGGFIIGFILGLKMG